MKQNIFFFFLSEDDNENGQDDCRYNAADTQACERGIDRIGVV